MQFQNPFQRPSMYVLLLLAMSGWAGAGRTSTCNSSHDPGMLEPVVVGGIGDSGTRGIRNLLELLGVRICEATDKTGDDNGVQRATHRLLYGPRGIFEHVEGHPITAEGRRRYGAKFSRPDAAAQAAYFSPAPDLRPGQLGVLLRNWDGLRGSSTSSSSSFKSAYSTRNIHDGTRRKIDEDPYATYLRQLIQHHDYVPDSEGVSSLCRAIAASHTCARKVVPSRTLPEVKAAAYAASKAGEKWLNDVWAFKEPRTAFFLKEFDELLSGHRVRFVHVLRDGRDVALGDLRLVTSLACAAYFTAQDSTESSSRNSSSNGELLEEGIVSEVDETTSRRRSTRSAFIQRFDTSQGHLLRQAQKYPLGRACSAAGKAPQLVVWALLNEAIADEALARFGPSRYFAIRIEDVALDPNPVPTIHALLRFLRGINDSVDVGAPPSSSHTSYAGSTTSSSSSSADIRSHTTSTSSSGVYPGPSPMSPTERFVRADQRAVAAVAEHIAGKHAAAYGGQKFGSNAQRLALLQALHAELGGALLGATTSGALHEDSEGMSSSATSHNGIKAGGVQAVQHALVRFGYRLEGWGLAERAWSATQHHSLYQGFIEGRGD